MKFCQTLIAVLYVISFFKVLHEDVNGRKAKDPLGFAGVVVTIVIYSTMAFVYWGAGLFSTLNE